MIRKSGLFLVMLGALALSFSGQVDAVRPLLGDRLSIVFAATNDVAALLALNEVLGSGRDRSVRRWAWVALVLGGGSALALNTWDAVRKSVLPDPASVLVGAEPVVLAWVLSHVVAMTLGQRSQHPEETASEPETVPPSKAVTSTVEAAVTPTSREAFQEAAPTLVSDVSAPAHTPSRPTVASQEPGPDTESDSANSEALPNAAEQAAEALPVRLIDRAEKLERQARQRSGGKRGLPYREATRALGVRYSTAKTALDAARARIRDDKAVTTAA